MEERIDERKEEGHARRSRKKLKKNLFLCIFQ
jgi:hypothetical protein